MRVNNDINIKLWICKSIIKHAWWIGLLTWLKHPHIDWPHGGHESRACLEFVLLHSSIIFIYLIVVCLEKILHQIFFYLDVQMKTSRKMKRIHFYFYEFYKVQATRLLAKPRSLACMDKEKLLYSENCLLYLGFFGGSYFQWLCGLVEWQ